MENVKCRRFDIFLADLKRFGIEEPHYIICLSNWKNNIKSPEINSCMITSKIKNHPSHVTFEGFGLGKSQVKCEKIHTVLKSELIKKVGHIDDASLQISIDQALAQQLQLDNKYNNFDALDLEKLFIDNNDKVESTKVKLEKLKSEIHANFYSGKYKEAIILSYKLKELAQKTNVENRNEYIWVSLYMKGLSNLKLNNVSDALLDAQESITYIRPQENNVYYSLNLWLLSRIYEETGDTMKAKNIYKTLIKYYKNNYENILRISCCFNLAKLYLNKKAMTKIYHMLENSTCTNRNIFNTQNYKDEILTDMKKELDAFKSI